MDRNTSQLWVYVFPSQLMQCLFLHTISKVCKQNVGCCRTVPWILQQQRTLIYRWRSLSHNTHRLCVCVGVQFTFHLPGSCSLGAKPADHLSRECIRIPWIGRIHPPTHIKPAAWTTFFGPAHKVPTNTQRQSCNLRQTHTNSLFVSNPHIHTRSHTTSLSWSSEGWNGTTTMSRVLKNLILHNL